MNISLILNFNSKVKIGGHMQNIKSRTDQFYGVLKNSASLNRSFIAKLSRDESGAKKVVSNVLASPVT